MVFFPFSIETLIGISLIPVTLSEGVFGGRNMGALYVLDVPLKIIIVHNARKSSTTVILDYYR